METFDIFIGSYEDFLENYNSAGGNGGVANGSLYYISDSSNVAYYTYDCDRDKWLAVEGTANDSYSKSHPSICPHCGAPTKPHLDNCEYCEVYFD